MEKTIGILSDITFDLILKEFKNHIPQKILFNKYENIATALLTQTVELQQPDFLVVHCETIFNQYQEEEIEAIINALNIFADKYKGTLIVSGFAKFNQHYNLSTPLTSNTFELASKQNVLYADYASLVAEEGLKNVYHYPLGHLYQMPFTKPFLKKWGNYWQNYFRFLNKPEQKVIVLDCDNTLWGGILGEDGADKVQINKNADGIIFLHFQQWLKERQRDGFVLCLCSKNNESEVADFFAKRNMPLKWDDFLVKKVNWNDKYLNLNEIAQELNLGTDSLIFIDDNEFELSSVHALMPEVSCLQFRSEYTQYLELTRNFVFKRKQILIEDKQKQQQYKDELARNAFKTELSFEDYVKSLEIVTELQVNELENVDRYAQLTEKTNQFNFNKIAYNTPQLRAFVEKGNYIFGLKVADKFGDYGIVGVMLVAVDKKERTSKIHNFLMSCRALGRGIEEQFFSDVKEKMAIQQLPIVGIDFVSTSKNQPAKTFYECIVLNKPV